MRCFNGRNREREVCKKREDILSAECGVDTRAVNEEMMYVN